MKVFKSKSVSALPAGLLFFSIACCAQAESYGTQESMRDNPTAVSESANNSVKHRSYGSKVGNKLVRGFANMTTAFVEIPKGIINTTNASGVGGEGSNFLWGLGGGGIIGIVNMLGRTASGIIDVVTFPVPTESMTLPEYPWQQFTEDTSYGKVLKYDDN
ncbi:MAG: exosortase system-associated protein, TIGR04073 family [Gammaproteobacteria bacterium]